ncbi:hypothetical protein GCM10011452_35590 [Gemmobacter lanyuensis]|uniref:O-antigen ligase-related domain-containing protein n=1 Tax=Gemmobacter lanyuensis TaxID=1054497 RepID=A0A918J4M4_9RHOB|nr:O-antigen ligase family protein [Gemmobacter lanyuensis]GGW44142.1 hypothetical protein GCM10011452_35590 [Gemmobacter lanyuensis]
MIVAFCFFVRFGGQLAESRLWRVAVYVGCAIAIAAVSVAGMPKNITGGTMTYILAIAAVLYLRSTRGAGGMVALVFVVVAIAIGLLMEFRAILAYAVVLLAVRYGVRVFPRWLAFWGGIAAVIAAAWLAVWFFSNLYSSETAAVVRQWIEAQTGRRVESGREWLWPMILNTVGPQPWFGLGSGVLPRDFLSTDYSAHNYYIQTIMQVGYVGLGALGLYLASVWRLLIGVRNAAAGAFAAGVMVMFCLHNITEVLMFQNGLTAGLPAWISIGLGIGASVKACSNSKA